jgi:hypothetical protein
MAVVLYCLTLNPCRSTRKDSWELTCCTRQFRVFVQWLFPFRNRIYNRIFQLNVKMIGTLKLRTALSACISKLLSFKFTETSDRAFVNTEINFWHAQKAENFWTTWRMLVYIEALYFIEFHSDGHRACYVCLPSHIHWSPYNRVCNTG